MQPSAQITLCSPGHGLACFACCPPIRPRGYDHAQWHSSLRRLFIDSTESIRSGVLPQKIMLGFWCDGLGFLDSKGRTIGCLLHPAQNNGQDLRGPTGYQEKCARESCAPSRAFASLETEVADGLAGLCRGMDSFAFSSAANPLMKLLSFGPKVSKAVFSMNPGELKAISALAWLDELDPQMGWLLGRMAGANGPSFLERHDVAVQASDAAAKLAQRIGPPPPIDSGEPPYKLCDEWEARFWKAISRRNKLRPADLRAWRECLEELI